MLRKDKEKVVADLADRLRASETLILADYRGLSVSEIDEVRTKILEHGARFTVVKNTLTKRAAEAAGLDTLTALLDGPTAIAFVGDGDMVGVARALNETAKRTRILSIKGGILQGAPMEAAQVVELASLPPTDVLRGQVLGVIVGPLTSIVGLLGAPLQDLVGLIDARVDQLGEPEASAAEEEAPAEAPEASAEAVEASADAEETVEETVEEAPPEASAETSEETADEAAEETTEEE
jgi:large subunit ribosomal protein L10